MPSFAPLIDESTYFNHHHTGADTLDKVNPENLRRHVAAMTTSAWYLANMGAVDRPRPCSGRVIRTR